MPDTSWHEEVGSRVTSLKIIVGALLVGAAGFLTVAVVLVRLGILEPSEELAWVMNLVLILFLAGDLTAWFVVPNMIVSQGRRKIAAGSWSLPEGPQMANTASFIERTGDAGRLFVVYQTKTIVAAAILQSVGFFGIVVYMITSSMVGLVVAIVMTLGLAMHFPNRYGVIQWIENQLQLIEQERQSRRE